MPVMLHVDKNFQIQERRYWITNKTAHH